MSGALRPFRFSVYPSTYVQFERKSFIRSFKFKKHLRNIEGWI